MTMAEALIVTPVCPYVCTLHTYVCTSVQRRPLSKSNTFDQNLMKLGHIVEYHDVFFNGSALAQW